MNKTLCDEDDDDDQKVDDDNGNADDVDCGDDEGEGGQSVNNVSYT